MSRPQSVPEIPIPDFESERPSETRTRGAKSLTDFVGTKAPAKKRRGVPKLSEEKAGAARAQMAVMAESGDWDGAAPIHLVVLYEFLHTEVYGVAPLELDAKNRFLAAGAAGRLVASFFGDDYGRCVSFMRWAWHREQDREKWRRANGRDGNRIGWRLMFSASLVSDYRLHGERVGR